MNKIIYKIIPHPILSLVLFLMWIILNNSINPPDLILGIILALSIPQITTNFWSRKLANPQNILQVFAFMLIMAGDIIIANIRVSILILGRNSKLKPMFFTVPLTAENPYAISLLANCITLTPGTLSCKISLDNQKIFVHGLNVDDVEDVVAKIKSRYEQRIIKMFTKK